MTPSQSTIRSWRENPAQFVSEVFRITPDQWQEDALRSIGGPPNPRRRLCMKACTGPGKSAVLAWIGWHRMLCFADHGEHPKGIALSGEGRDNLKDNLWSELSKWQQRSELLKAAFSWNQERIAAIGFEQDWFLSARSYAKDANAEAIGKSLSGTHSRYPFMLLDETGAMPISVGQKASQIFTGSVVDGLIAMAGNPTSTTGLLYYVCTKEREFWLIVTITADPDDPKRTPRVSIDHAREQIALHGRENPWVMATILGLFPSHGFNTLFAIEDVESAMKRHLKEDQYSFQQRRLGIDVARFGDDRSVIFPRQGMAAFRPVELRGARTTDIAARVAVAKSRFKSEAEFVDDTGHWGHGVIDNLVSAGYNPLGIQFHAPAMDPRYKNRRAEMWMKMAEWVKSGAALPNIPSMVAELTTPTYTFSQGKFLLEEKDQIKARLGRSPDLADALALTFAWPEAPTGTNMPEFDERGRAKTAYVPFAGMSEDLQSGGRAETHYRPTY